MIKRITINDIHRTITLQYRDGKWMTVKGSAVDQYIRFTENVIKHCRTMHTFNDGRVQVFEM